MSVASLLTYYSNNNSINNNNVTSHNYEYPIMYIFILTKIITLYTESSEYNLDGSQKEFLS